VASLLRLLLADSGRPSGSSWLDEIERVSTAAARFAQNSLHAECLVNKWTYCFGYVLLFRSKILDIIITTYFINLCSFLFFRCCSKALR